MSDVERNPTIDDEKYRIDHVEKADVVAEGGIQPPARIFTPEEVRSFCCSAPSITDTALVTHTGGQALPKGRFPNYAHPLVRLLSALRQAPVLT